MTKCVKELRLRFLQSTSLNTWRLRIDWWLKLEYLNNLTSALETQKGIYKFPIQYLEEFKSYNQPTKTLIDHPREFLTGKMRNLNGNFYPHDQTLKIGPLRRVNRAYPIQLIYLWATIKLVKVLVATQGLVSLPVSRCKPVLHTIRCISIQPSQSAHGLSLTLEWLDPKKPPLTKRNFHLSSNL
jgi:hypothetical protein